MPANPTGCCGVACITPADIPGGALYADIESDCATMECLDAEMKASGSGESATWGIIGGCVVQGVMSCSGGVYTLRLTIPMCVVVVLSGSKISAPGDPVVIYFPSESFTGNMFCCSPGTYTVSATVTEP